MELVGNVARMATFRARDRSSAVLRSSRSEVWAALTDADLIAQITPYVTSIAVDGDRWTWRMGTIPVLGISVAPKFTEVTTRLTNQGEPLNQFALPRRTVRSFQLGVRVADRGEQPALAIFADLRQVDLRRRDLDRGQRHP